MLVPGLCSPQTTGSATAWKKYALALVASRQWARALSALDQAASMDGNAGTENERVLRLIASKVCLQLDDQGGEGGAWRAKAALELVHKAQRDARDAPAATDAARAVEQSNSKRRRKKHRGKGKDEQATTATPAAAGAPLPSDWQHAQCHEAVGICLAAWSARSGEASLEMEERHRLEKRSLLSLQSALQLHWSPTSLLAAANLYARARLFDAALTLTQQCLLVDSGNARAWWLLSLLVSTDTAPQKGVGALVQLARQCELFCGGNRLLECYRVWMVAAAAALRKGDARRALQLVHRALQVVGACRRFRRSGGAAPGADTVNDGVDTSAVSTLLESSSSLHSRSTLRSATAALDIRDMAHTLTSAGWDEMFGGPGAAGADADADRSDDGGAAPNAAKVTAASASASDAARAETDAVCELLLLAAKCYAALGEEHDCMALVSHAGALRPLDPLVLCALGECREKLSYGNAAAPDDTGNNVPGEAPQPVDQQMLRSAAQAYERALAVSPQCLPALVGIGRCYCRDPTAAKRQVAESALRRVVRERPATSAAWKTLAVVLEQRGEHDTSVECLFTVVSLERDEPAMPVEDVPFTF